MVIRLYSLLSIASPLRYTALANPYLTLTSMSIDRLTWKTYWNVRYATIDRRPHSTFSNHGWIEMKVDGVYEIPLPARGVHDLWRGLEETINDSRPSGP